MFFTDEEIYEAILEANLDVCDLLISLLENDQQNSDAYHIANSLKDQLDSVSSMLRTNMQKRFEVEV